MKPIEGAESEGALGFFKGVGKGLVGYVAIAAVKYRVPHLMTLKQCCHQACSGSLRPGFKCF